MRSDNVTRHQACLKTLARLRIFQRQEGGLFVLQKSFARHVQQALGSGVHRFFVAISQDVRLAMPEGRTVDLYASNQWEVRCLMQYFILLVLFMIGPGPIFQDMTVPIQFILQKLLLYAISGSGNLKTPVDISNSELDLDYILQSGNIVGGVSESERSITEDGFQFLLSDTDTQVWLVIKQYINWVEQGKSSESFTSLMEFMLQLGFEHECIPASDFSPEQIEICSHMCQLGLLYPFKSSNVLYLVPTKLATLLSNGSSRATQDDGFVIVETNYKVYAYTSSAVKQAILRLFVRCDLLLPNLFIGSISRESVMSALESGITAEQIIGYLGQHAHRQVSSRVPVVPAVVADQIRLWQKEIQRIQSIGSVLYKNFETPQLYKQVSTFAENIGSILHKNDTKMEMIANAVFHDRIRAEIKSIKESM